ncbi:2Fe-2S iron-sulfur cluster-binding protein [Streptomyces sp. NPDC005423]|uniref:2Fe-2S iron-sulfur cluster-binding protein n=1 Tax=Streptomyces sp. NPDC005423 TaxID=3155343 RepID=UPI0033BF7C60
MTDDQHGEGRPRSGGRWDPLPQGDYDDGATAFVKLPEGGIDALLAADSPLAAPGHGYVPPHITASHPVDTGTDPASSGGWGVPAEGVQWPEPNAAPHQGGADDRFTYRPPSTGQWTFEDTNAREAGGPPGHDVTGQWSIPVADGELPDESGEFTTSALVEQWGGTPPATLPGGAAAPWATEAAGQPWGEQASAAEVTDRIAAHPDERSGAEAAAEAPAATRPPAEPYGDPRSDLYTHGRGEAYPDPDAYADRYENPAAAADTAPAAARLPDAAPRSAPATDEPSGPADSAPHHEVSPPAEPFESAEPAEFFAPPESAAAPEPVESSAYEEGLAEGPEGPAEPPAAADGTDDAPGGPETVEAAVTPDGPDGSDASDRAAARPSASSGEEHPLASYVLRVNGVDRPVTDAWIGESLLYVLRERLGLAGAKDGCSQGECGACNVQVDGRLVASCLVPGVTAAGSEVRTVEGLAVDGRPSDVQRALAKCGAVQCGFCVPGMAMTVHDLLEGNPAPTELEARQALCGNLCRCSGYRGVLDAVQEVVAEREAHAAAAEPEPDGDEARIPHQAGPGAGGVNHSAFESPRRHDQAYGQDGGQA